MKACGVVVEYNPFHNGHAYHVHQAKKETGADVIIAVMSGNFLQRGEPAIMDKFYRTRAALTSGVDLVLELPYAFAVQNSDYFSKGAIQLLQAIGVSSLCFGSESGDADEFKKSYRQYMLHKETYDIELRKRLNDGISFPEASMHAYKKIGLTNPKLDLSQPNNILGLSYVKAILEEELPIEIHTIKRLKNHFHEPEIKDSIASATSIRKEIISNGHLTEKALGALPQRSIELLEAYREDASLWHHWESYFPLLHYRVQTMNMEQLREIHGMVEGLEHRLKNSAMSTEGLFPWIQKIKSKRYTWTRLQRLFTHILTNTTKNEIVPFLSSKEVPYIRILGMNDIGQKYVNHIRKQVEVPLVTKFKRNMHPLLELEEKATAAYYSILPPANRKTLFKQELRAPVRI